MFSSPPSSRTISGESQKPAFTAAAAEAQELEERMARLISLIEPVLVIALGAMIGAMMLSVMMPLAGVLSAMV